MQDKEEKLQNNAHWTNHFLRQTKFNLWTFQRIYECLEFCYLISLQLKRKCAQLAADFDTCNLSLDQTHIYFVTCHVSNAKM